jgi:tRNA modification GTPase
MVELSSHGGAVSLKAILALANRLGARLAEPGEFTRRAFLSGRIDLAQAEAVLDIIQAKTQAALRVSTHQLKGELSAELERIRGQLTDVYVQMEAVLNFPEDAIDTDGTAGSRQGFAKTLKAAQARVEHLLKSSEHGRILKEGIRVVICGRTNVGKSSLLNALLKVPRAIVSDIPGTTRDTIEETAQIKGIPFQLTDTAGILKARDFIEEEALRRSHQSIQAADLVLLVFDGSEALKSDDELLMDTLQGDNILALLNKCDLPQKVDAQAVRKKYAGARVLKVSAVTGAGLDHLERTVLEHVWHEKKVDTHGILVNNLRHMEALNSGLASLKKAGEILSEGISLEFVSEEIKAAVHCLDRITGRDIDADLLESIFERFCVGK